MSYWNEKFSTASTWSNFLFGKNDKYSCRKSQQKRIIMYPTSDYF